MNSTKETTVRFTQDEANDLATILENWRDTPDPAELNERDTDLLDEFITNLRQY